MNEEFEKWWCEQETLEDPPTERDAYLAGAAAMREKCAEVAEGCWGNGERIAAAIRKIEVE